MRNSRSHPSTLTAIYHWKSLWSILYVSSYILQSDYKLGFTGYTFLNSILNCVALHYIADEYLLHDTPYNKCQRCGEVGWMSGLQMRFFQPSCKVPDLREALKRREDYGYFRRKSFLIYAVIPSGPVDLCKLSASPYWYLCQSYACKRMKKVSWLWTSLPVSFKQMSIGCWLLLSLGYIRPFMVLRYLLSFSFSKRKLKSLWEEKDTLVR